jgi:hypothetical protein
MAYQPDDPDSLFVGKQESSTSKHSRSKHPNSIQIGPSTKVSKTIIVDKKAAKPRGNSYNTH